MESNLNKPYLTIVDIDQCMSNNYFPIFTTIVHILG